MGSSGQYSSELIYLLARVEESLWTHDLSSFVSGGIGEMRSEALAELLVRMLDEFWKVCLTIVAPSPRTSHLGSF